MRTSRPVAEKLGAVRQDPELHGLLFTLINRATGGRQERAARACRHLTTGEGRRLRLELWAPHVHAHERPQPVKLPRRKSLRGGRGRSHTASSLGTFRRWRNQRAQAGTRGAKKRTKLTQHTGEALIAPRVPALQVPGGRAFGYPKQ